MRFERVRLRDFKCYDDADLALRDGVTVIHGVNGSGKSSLLEACFFAPYSAKKHASSSEDFPLPLTPWMTVTPGDSVSSLSA